MLRSKILIGFTVAAIAVAACSRSSGTDASGEKTTITMLIAEGPEELQTFEAIAEAYNASQGAIELELIPVSEDEDVVTRLASDIAGGNAPDIFFANYRYVSQFASTGQVVPLDDQIAASTDLDMADLYPIAVDAYNLGGQQYCLPFNASSLVVYYNENLFEQAGIEPPKDHWTWKEFVAAAKATTGLTPIDATSSDPIDQTYGVGVDPIMIRVSPFVWSGGGTIVDDQENPTKMTLATLKAVPALADFLSLQAPLQVSPPKELMESEGATSLFANGRLGMVLDSRKIVPELRTVTGFDWNVLPLPSIGEPSSILHSDGYCITSGSEHPEEAFDFIEFAMGKEAQELGAQSGRAVPSSISVAESKAFLDPNASPTNSVVFLDDLDHAQLVPKVSTWTEIEATADGILEEAFFEGERAEETAVRIDQDTKPMFEEAVPVDG